MLLISSPEFENHVPPPGHPERPERAQVFEAVTARWLQNGGRVEAPRTATRSQLERTHTTAHIEAIERTAGRAVMLDPDTFTSADSADIALLAAGAAVQAIEFAIGSREPAFALVRPPGHHAERDRAMGFCLYNNVAVAAAAARAAGVARVAIVDIDVHHGNGTQHIFFEDPAVLYISTHQFPFYPGTGASEERGRGSGAGFTVNVPLEAGATDDDYLRVHEAVVLPVLDQFRPELTIVSVGYDAHEKDPLASMRMTAAGYGCIIHGLLATASRHGSIACVTEGGYDLSALAESLDATCSVLSGKAMDAGLPPSRAPRASASLAGAFGGGGKAEPTGPFDGETARSKRAIGAVRAAQKGFWRL